MKRVVLLTIILLLLLAAGCVETAKTPLDYASYGDTGVFRIDGRAYERTDYRENTALSYAALVGRAAERLSGQTRVFSMIVPTAYGIMMTDEEKALVESYVDPLPCISAIYAAMPDIVIKLSLCDKLMEHRDEAIYFRTDHHWTARGAYLGYEAFCEAKGIEPIPLSEYRSVSFAGFLGSFFTASGGDEKLLPEEVEAFYPISGNVTLTVTDENGITEVRPMVADAAELPPSAKYMTFAGGNNPYSVIENPDVTDGSVLIVVKESFGNPVLAFLCGHYSTIYVIDYRYWMGSLLELVQETYADELLFINSFPAVNNGSNVGFLAMTIDD